VLTHFDVDHAGGSSALVGRVGTLVHGPVDERAEPIVAEIVAGGATAQEARRGDAWLLGELRIDALWPVGGPEPGNDASVAVAIDLPGEDGSGGGLELVVLGDLGAVAQSRLLREGVPGPASVVVVAHHGSADQLPALYRRLGAAVGLVGVGPNDFGHPTDAALRLVRDTGGAPLRTDQLGTIALAVDDAGVRVWSERVGGPP
ncbi:MAG: competence protein ComEC, partial [Agrococcus sp.]